MVFNADILRLTGVDGGGQYWYELLNTIKDIRSSEKVLYRQVLDNILSAGGNEILTDVGSVSAQQARDKALDEYRKYQVRTLSPVERDYIASLEAAAKSAIR